MNHPSMPQESATTPVSARLNKHFVSCSAAAAGVASFFGGSSPADAALVYSGVQNAPIHTSTVDGGMYMNIESPFNFEQGARPAGWDLNPYAAGSRIYANGNTQLVIAGDNAANLGFGTTIDIGQAFSAVSFYGGVDIPSISTGYIGFKFDPDSVVGAQTWFGWARIAVGNNTGAVDGSVIEWAYDDAGDSIKVGAVPEPSSIAMLAMGAAGLLTLRQRRARATV